MICMISIFDCVAAIAEVFSGHHKKMVWSRSEVLELYRSENKCVPMIGEFDEIFRKYSARWQDRVRPTRRPFDVLFRSRLSPEPSDYDVQVSSDQILGRARTRITELGVDPTDLTISSAAYNFVRKDLVEIVCPHLRLWSIRQTQALRRLVAIAVFPASGPPNKEDTMGPLSAHFRESDWRIPYVTEDE